jgi:hypothetical protein
MFTHNQHENKQCLGDFQQGSVLWDAGGGIGQKRSFAPFWGLAGLTEQSEGSDSCHWNESEGTRSPFLLPGLCRGTSN